MTLVVVINIGIVQHYTRIRDILVFYCKYLIFLLCRHEETYPIGGAVPQLNETYNIQTAEQEHEVSVSTQESLVLLNLTRMSDGFTTMNSTEARALLDNDEMNFVRENPFNKDDLCLSSAGQDLAGLSATSSFNFQPWSSVLGSISGAGRRPDFGVYHNIISPLNKPTRLILGI